MKILCLNVVFKLPDDFDGDFNEAIRSIADYREERGYAPVPVPSNAELIPGLNMISDEHWETFLKAHSEEKKHLVGHMFFGEFKDGNWIRRK